MVVVEALTEEIEEEVVVVVVVVEEEGEEAEESGNSAGQELDDEKLQGNIMCNLMHFKEKVDVDHVV